MKLIVTTTIAIMSAGYTSHTDNPLAIAFRYAHPGMENVKVHNGRLTATREGYPVRFLIENYTVKVHQKLLSGEIEYYECVLRPLPIPVEHLNSTI